MTQIADINDRRASLTLRLVTQKADIDDRGASLTLRLMITFRP